MPSYTSPDGKFHVPAGGAVDPCVALAQAMKRDRKAEDNDREAAFWAGWTDADEAAFQADMQRIMQRVGGARTAESSSQSQRSSEFACDTSLLESSIAQEA
jgi:hypothetical protein